VTAVLELAADAIVAVEGPPVCFQTPAIRVVPVAGVDLLVTVAEMVGNVMVCSVPIVTVGTVLAVPTSDDVELVFPSGVETPAESTVTDTFEEADCPRLLVAVKVKI
jgi:hypothetical protein